MNQNLSVMGVASCRSTFLCLILRGCLVLSRFSVHDWGVSCVSVWVVRVVGFDPRSGPAQPNPARPCAPLAPTPSHAPPPPLPLSFGFPAQQPPSPSSTSLSPWCLRDWRRRSPEFGPRGELPSPSLLLSLPLPPLPFPVRPPLSPLRAAAPAPAPPLRAALAHPAPASPRGGARTPRPGLPRGGVRPCPSPARWRPPPAPPPRGGAHPRPRRGPPALAPGAAGPRRNLPYPGSAPAPGAASPAPGADPAPARPLPPTRSSLRAASAPCVWRPSSRRDSRGLVYPLTHSRVRKPTRAVIISGL
jgi:hypothetical protein